MFRPIEDVNPFYSRGNKNNRARDRIIKRDGAYCQKCKTVDNLTLDHIVPKSKGGKSEDSNYQILCEPCNTDKGDTIKDHPYEKPEWLLTNESMQREVERLRIVKKEEKKRSLLWSIRSSIIEILEAIKK